MYIFNKQARVNTITELKQGVRDWGKGMGCPGKLKGNRELYMDTEVSGREESNRERGGEVSKGHNARKSSKNKGPFQGSYGNLLQ